MSYVLSAHAETIIREREIAPGWLDAAMNAPDLLLPHESDPTLHHALKLIPDFGDRVLRVIYNATKEPPLIVSYWIPSPRDITVYFDRTIEYDPTADALYVRLG